MARGVAGSPGPRSRPIGVHERGPGPGDTFSLPYLRRRRLPKALEQVKELGGNVVHPGEKWAICRDSEGQPLRAGGEGPVA